MATRRAVANGNWSATSTWNGGVVPTNGDTVYANGFNVTLDSDVLIGGANNPIVNTGSLVSGQWYEIVNVGGQNWTTIGAASNTTGTVFQSTGTGTAGNLGTAKALATLTTATNTAAGATTGGGVFTMPTIVAMTADLRAGTTTCLNVTATTGTLTLSGIRAVGGSSTSANAISSSAAISANQCTLNGGSTTSASSINYTSTAQANITASTIIGGANNSPSINNNSATATIAISDSTLGSGGGSTSNAIANSSTGSVTITNSTLTGGSGVATSSAALNSTTGTITISGSTLNASNGSCVTNSSTGTLIITTSTFTASAFANAVNIVNTGADVRLSGDFLDHWSGWKAVNGAKWRLGTTPAAARTRYALAGTTDSYIEMFTADNTGFGLPAANHVRSGISYGGGAVTGTCAVPAAGSVAFGVPVDNTTGTAILTQANVQAALTAQGLTSARAGNLDNLDAAVSSRLAPSGTLATVTNLTNAPASVTPADIWGYNSRTLTSASGPTAVEIRQEMDSNSTKLANLDATVSSRLAAASYTAPSAAPSAASVATAVRSELSTELARVDVAVSSRLAASESTKLDAVKAQTDQLPIQRLQNVATTNIVGTLIAQANS